MKLFPLAALVLFAACLTGPEAKLEARYSVTDVDSLQSMVTFEAQAPDTLWWRLDWVDRGMLFDYGTAVYDVEVPVTFAKGFQFWMDFTVWTLTETVTVSFMSPKEE